MVAGAWLVADAWLVASASPVVRLGLRAHGTRYERERWGAKEKANSATRTAERREGLGRPSEDPDAPRVEDPPRRRSTSGDPDAARVEDPPRRRPREPASILLPQVSPVIPEQDWRPVISHYQKAGELVWDWDYGPVFKKTFKWCWDKKAEKLRLAFRMRRMRSRLCVSSMMAICQTISDEEDEEEDEVL